MPEFISAAAPALAPVCATCGHSLASSAEPTRESSQTVHREPRAKVFAPGTLLAGRYRIVALLGSGGTGEVYRADDMTLDQPVALKFYPGRLQGDPDTLTRFYREVRLARQISHPNICRVFDISETEGRAFITMEFVRGEDLHTLLRRIGKLSHDKALDVALQLCSGLTAAHAAGILHRDLKPANVMLDDRGNVRITDFGLSAPAGDLHHELDAGTPGYMSPEQLAGKEVTARSDLYSLGLVLYEIFTGKRGIDLQTAAELLRPERAVPTPQNLHGLNPWVRQAILQCLEPEPGNRPASALQVAATLARGNEIPGEALRETAGVTVRPEAAAEAGEHTLARLGWRLAGIGLFGRALMQLLSAFGTGVLTSDTLPTNASVPAAFTWSWGMHLGDLVCLIGILLILRFDQRISPHPLPHQVDTSVHIFPAA